ncbi:MAG: redox-sensing transcriptional repressor Rex [Actinomycetota bacterium]|nr:redox-sensing transcriptional repressor Rex [Actinomycetota bacterium]
MATHSGDRAGRRADRVRDIPQASAARLPGYLRVLDEFPFGRTVRSKDLARAAGVDAAKLRRDLSFLGSYGVRGVGYDTATLKAEISVVLGAHVDHRVALVGVGNLGHALAGYSGFAGHGFRLVALFDIDPHVVGTTAAAVGGQAGLLVHDIAYATTVLATERVTIGIVTTPADAAQDSADLLVGAGVRSILNFAPCPLDVPVDVHVRQVDLGLELQMLAFHEASRPDELGAALSTAAAL